MTKTIKIERDLKDIVIMALRYAIGRKTYVTGEICDYIKKHPELIDNRVKKVMLSDLQKIDEYYSKYDNTDRPSFEMLKRWLEKLEAEDEND